MAQRRFHNYQDAVESSRLQERFAQMFPPGRYGGFNTFNPSAGTLNFGIQHTTNPAKKTVVNPGSPSIISDLGLLVTNQGTFIEEDAEITGLSVASNAANAFTRYDILYVEHEHVNVVGGQAATYGVVTGTAGWTLPALPDPTLQTAIGIIQIHANEATLDNAFYSPLGVPSVGAEEDLVWEDLSPYLNDGWAASGGVDLEIALDKYGWVHMRGVLDSTSATGDTAFTGVPGKYFSKKVYGVGVGTYNIQVGDSVYTPGNNNTVNMKVNSFAPGLTPGTWIGTIVIDSATAPNSVVLNGVSWWVGKDPAVYF